ncbi:OLC1v1002957C1 [Oldenlandia corymbosa var. corymbosa]|uniref:OLC1v1002957C1 n=1 Tax=Oldenlandia corymbosa var. corymbosa TaxID=529605 RepID=A0AAV1DBV0_OLDCO|nr:OLC1v1002957C1 [Oldenlandia corymbosa var. corymbosa]
MTSASELFHNRRSRLGRSSHLEFVGNGGEEQPAPPLYSHFSRLPPHHRRHHRQSYHHSNNHHHHPTSPSSSNTRRDLNRLDFDAFDPALPRRSPHHPRPHRPSFQGSSSSAYEEVNIPQNGRTLRDRLRSAGSERLPGTVLLARERLLQRLRGVSISANRQRLRFPSSIHHNDNLIEDDFSLANRDWENEISQEWFTGAIPFNDILSVEKTKRPPGLTQEAVDDLQVEIFSKHSKNGEEGMSNGLEECSICLESFMEGDKLIRLTCEHRFHCYCLDPWLRQCGDCPYCRKAVQMRSDG